MFRHCYKISQRNSHPRKLTVHFCAILQDTMVAKVQLSWLQPYKPYKLLSQKITVVQSVRLVKFCLRRSQSCKVQSLYMGNFEMFSLYYLPWKLLLTINRFSLTPSFSQKTKLLRDEIM